jgi:DNA-binding GntR family transcriptional regulator
MLDATIADDDWANNAQQFHDAMIELCGNATVGLVINSVFALWNEHQEQWTASHRDEKYISPGKRRKTIDAHHRIIQLIEDGAVGAVKRAERAHLRDLHQVLLSKQDVTVSVTASARRHGMEPTLRHVPYLGAGEVSGPAAS